MNIEANLNEYLKDRHPTARYASFDYCFNYFRQYREHVTREELLDGVRLELSCLHLGFYLASWGMLRGSSALLKRSVRHYVPVIEAIASSPNDVWEVDADCYTEGNCDLLMETADRLAAALPDRASDILITKIMLGVFGCVPAFDTYFKKGLGVWRFNKKALRRVADFYSAHSNVIEQYRVPTLDFGAGTDTNRLYSRAKVIDMAFFIEGSR